MLTSTGNSTYTASGAAYREGGYTNYRFNNTDHFLNGNTAITPANATIGTYTWSLDDNAYATVNSTSGVVTVTSLPEYDITLTLTVTATATGGTPAAPSNTTLTGTKQITIQGTKPSAPTITVSGTNVTLATTAAGSTTIRYTLDGTDPTASTGTVYSGAIDLSGSTTSPVTIKAITVRSGNVSDVTEQSVTLTLPEPTITINGEAQTATIASSIAGATIYYTTDGSTPTTSSSQYTGTLTGLDYMTIVKAIAVKDGWDNSPVASGIVTIPSGVGGGVVTLFDYEPHSWSYYSDPECPIRSLSPADVKITYYGDGIVMTGNADYTASSTDFIQPGNANYVGGAKVNVGGEDENTFVYYKTLERGANTQTVWTYSTDHSSAASRCPYTTIYNPFQVRPTYGSRGSTDANDFTGWRGFQCWRLKSVTGGAVYSAASSVTALSVGAVVNAETEIYFAPNNEYGMEVELEAVWARAYLVKGNNGNANAILNYGNLGVERNFMTLTANQNYKFNGTSGRRITNVDRAVTISCYYPNGEAPDGTNGVVVGNDNNITLGADTKFENVTLSAAASSYTLTASGYNVIIGRGCTSTNIGTVRGLSGNTSGAVEYTIRLESGTFGTFNMIDGTTYTHSGTVSARTIFGSDYDRAKEDNSKLSIAANSTVYGASQYQQFSSNTNRNNLTYEWLIKSGTVQSSKSVADGAAANCIYMGNSGNGNDSDGNRYQGKRRLVMEGGEVCNISGGLNNYGNNYATYIVNDGWAVQICIKGGTVRGAIFGAAAFAGASGDRLFLFTGGTINGWVAGGANGTQNTGGELYGSTAMYMGGNTVIGSSTGGAHVGGYNSTYGTNGADGGHVFGAGCGILPTNGNFQNGTVGRVDNSTIVVADNAHIWRDVHGGGNYGWVRDNGSSNIYVAGGTIGGIDGCGNVFGGSNNQQGQEVSITVKGGDVKGGVYGGSHSWGTINDNVTMTISGGLIEQGAFGGGYGTSSNSCNVNGTVDITMTGGTVLYGLYGGGNVNCTVGSVTMHVDGGQVGTTSQHANIHGGGYGYQTVVTGDVNLTLGSGCDATDGVTVYGDVYGGSAEGQVNGTSAQTWYTTNVSLYKGTIYGGLYGGGLGSASHAANVNGPVTVKVYGGSVRPNDGTGENGSGGVFGCNNVNGTPTGTVTVDLYGTDPAEAGQTFALYAVYGGGNRSDYTGTPVVTIHGCDNNIEYVYGGGNASDVAATNVTIWGGHIGNAFGGGNGFSTTGNHTNAGAAHYNPGANITTGGTHLTIHGGQVDAAFGGSNQYGRIDGGINVTVVEGVESGTDPCSGTAYAACTNNTIGELYGGGNQAPAQTSGGAFITPSVTISSCDMEITNLFGGAKAADHGADINLVITKGKFQNVFGGNNLGGTITGNVTLTLNGGTMINAFGGNNQGGSITGTITVTMDSTGTECPLQVENVYGGGNMAAYEPTDNTITSPVVNIVNGTVRNAVFGGGLGSAADVTANPQVTIGGTGTKHAVVGGRLIDDSDDGAGNVYGGGSQADVVSTGASNGNTHVILTGNAHVKGNVYGGGNQADVQGNTNVELR